MRNLFVKILAWFWIATALVIMVVFLTNSLTSRDEPRPQTPARLPAPQRSPA